MNDSADDEAVAEVRRARGLLAVGAAMLAGVLLAGAALYKAPVDQPAEPGQGEAARLISAAS